MRTHSSPKAIAACAGFLFMSFGIAQAADPVPIEDPAPPAEVVENYGFYISVFGGLNYLDTITFSGTIGGAPETVEVDYDHGFVIGAAVGVELPTYSFGSITPRVELELSYRANDVDSIAFSGNGPASEINVSGETTSLAVFGNVLLDIDTGTFITPYVGGGVGVAFVENSFRYGPGVTVPDSDENFALQAIAGLSFDITEQFAVTVDGRYSRFFDVSSRRLSPAGALTGTISEDLENYAATIGVRYKF